MSSMVIERGQGTMSIRKETKAMATTRRNFIGMLGAATAIGSTTAVAFAGEPEFRELDLGNMYVFRGIPDGIPESEYHGRDYWYRTLHDALLYLENNGGLESVFKVANKRNLYFKPLVDDESDKIHITEAWLREFWRRHKDDAV